MSSPPPPFDLEFPPLLDTPPPRLKAYPKETVVAEKLEAIVDLGEANSRMKDYYDLIALSRLFAFDGETLSRAVAATFKRRNTGMPAERPPGLSNAFATDGQKAATWTAFYRREALLLPVGEFPETVDEIAAFVMPVALAARSGDVLSQSWQPGGPWRAPLRGP
jgi:Nucleotidyl transferase AbiEii toxin, Type IV TA system